MPSCVSLHTSGYASYFAAGRPPRVRSTTLRSIIKTKTPEIVQYFRKPSKNHTKTAYENKVSVVQSVFCIHEH